MTDPRRRQLAKLALACAVAPWSGRATAVDYPTRPVRFVVPYPPGGGNDLFARILAKKLTENAGQPFVIDNRGGASGLIGGEQVARAPADGYTIMVDQSSVATNPLLYKKVPFDAHKDLDPVILGVTIDNVILVSSQSPWQTLPELIAEAKAKPRAITYGSPGLGSSQHLGMELLQKAGGFELLHVPYKSTSQGLVAVTTDEIKIFMISIPTALPFITSGKLRALANTGAERAMVLPKTPTVAEAGVSGYVNSNWLGIFTTAGSPPDVVAELNRQFDVALKAPDTRESLVQLSYRVHGGAPSALRQTMRNEIATNQPLIQRAGIQLD